MGLSVGGRFLNPPRRRRQPASLPCHNTAGSVSITGKEVFMKTWNVIRIAVAAVVLSLAGVASAQTITGQLVGRVLDAETGKAIVGATVTASSPAWIDQSVTTDANGSYVLALLPPNHYAVSVEARGYMEAHPRTVQVMIDWRIRNDFRLLSATAGTGAKAPILAQNR
jgi:hypothetical protein